MPINLASLQRQTRRIHDEFAGSPYFVEYFPHKVDDEVSVLFAQLKSTDGAAPLAKALNMILSAWDLTVDDMTMLPTSLENLLALPTPLLMQMAGKIVEDLWPDDPTAASSNTSSQGGRLVKFRTGTSASSQPAGSESTLGTSPASQIPLANLVGPSGQE